MRRAAVALIAAAIVVGSATPAQAKSYRFTKVVQSIAIQPDGSFVVAETRTFSFSGSFHFAFITIPRGRWRIEPIEVCEVTNPTTCNAYKQNDSESPGTWKFSQTDNDEIRWFYAAQDQQRSFGIV